MVCRMPSAATTTTGGGDRGATDGATTIAVNLSKSYLQTLFEEVIPAGTVDTGWGIWTERAERPSWICRHQKLT